MASQELTFALRAVNEASRVLKDVQGDIEKTGNVAQSSSGRTSKFGSALGDVAKIAGGFVVAQGLMKLPGLFAGFIGGASSLNESLSKVSVVFGENAKEIENWAGTAAKAMGLSKGAALEAAGTFGNFLQAMGATRPEATSMSKSMVQLAADLGSFNNADPTEVLLALRSGLSGEAEPMRKFGVALSETAVKAKALEMGLSATGKELTEQQKIQARYAIIMEQTTTAQGDFARTSGGLANQTKILKASLKDASDQIGTALLPAIVATAGALITALPVVIAFGKELAEKVAPAVSAVGDFLLAIGAIAWDKLVGAWEVVTPYLEAAGKVTWDALVKVGEVTWVAMQESWEGIAAAMGKIDWQPLIDASGRFGLAAIDTENWARAWETVREKVQPAVDILRPLVDDLLVSLRQAFEDVIRELDPLIEEFKKFAVTLAPLEPLLKPLGIVLGVVIVAQLAILLLALQGLVEFISFVMVVALQVLTIEVGIIAKAIEAFGGVVGTVVPPVIAWLDSMAGKFAEVAGTIAESVSGFYSSGKAVITGLWDGMVDVWTKAWEWLGNLGSGAVAAIGDLSRILWDIGSAIMGGLWGGMKAKWWEMAGWLGGIGGEIQKIKGPIEEDRQLLVLQGQAIMEGLWRGLHEMWNRLVAPFLANIVSEMGAAGAAAVAAFNNAVEPLGFTPLGGKLSTATSLETLASAFSVPEYAAILKRIDAYNATPAPGSRVPPPPSAPRYTGQGTGTGFSDKTTPPPGWRTTGTNPQVYWDPQRGEWRFNSFPNAPDMDISDPASGLGGNPYGPRVGSPAPLGGGAKPRFNPATDATGFGAAAPQTITINVYANAVGMTTADLAIAIRRELSRAM
ncbi:MAG: phage tail protein [Chloroflexota bacterium]